MIKIVRTFMFALLVTSFVLAACAPATTQAPLDTQPRASPGGAKSSALQAEPESQPPWGPPV